MSNKNKNYKYIIGIFLMTFLLIGMAKGLDAKAATSGKCGTHVKWTYKSGTLTISGKGKMKNYKYNTDAPWYKYEKSIKKAVIKNGVTNVGNSSFSCGPEGAYRKIKKVSLGKDVKTIGKYAFTGCCAATVKFPKGLKSIGDYAFSDGSLKTANFPSTLNSIGKCAFDSCSFTKITLPSSVKKIGEEAFSYSEKLVSVSIKNKKVKIGKDAFGYCNSKLILYGYDGSTVQKYAKESGIQFSSLNEETGFHYLNISNLKKWNYDEEDLRKIDKKYFSTGSLNIKNGTATITFAEGLYHVQAYLLNNKKALLKEYNSFEDANDAPFKVTGLGKNKLYYYRVRKGEWLGDKKSPWSDYRAFITADYKYMAKSKISLAVKVPKIAGVKNYTVYVSTNKTSGYKKVKTIKPGKSVTISKYKGKKLKKNKNYYIKFVAKTKDGIFCDTVVYRYKTQK